MKKWVIQFTSQPNGIIKEEIEVEGSFLDVLNKIEELSPEYEYAIVLFKVEVPRFVRKNGREIIESIEFLHEVAILNTANVSALIEDISNSIRQIG